MNKYKAPLITIIVITMIVFSLTGSIQLIESIYIEKLRTSDDDNKIEAAKVLTMLRSKKSIPLLLNIIKNDKREHIYLVSNELKKGDYYEITPIAFSVYKFGKSARGLVQKEWEREDSSYRESNLLKDDRYLTVLSALQTLIDNHEIKYEIIVFDYNKNRLNY